LIYGVPNINTSGEESMEANKVTRGKLCWGCGHNQYSEYGKDKDKWYVCLSCGATTTEKEMTRKERKRRK
jgi:hypothetical protein